MKFSSRIAACFVILALVGQGVYPGLILCRGEGDHVAVETTFDLCCASFIQIPTQTPGAAISEEAESLEHSGCGPCTDTILDANLFRIPTHELYARVGTTHVTTIHPDDISLQTRTLWLDFITPEKLALIPIKTTILLL